MRSRSYYATAGSSFLLLSISCLMQGAPVEEKKADTPVVDLSSGGTEIDCDAETDCDAEKPLSLEDGDPGFHRMVQGVDTGMEHVMAHLPDHMQQIEEPPVLKCPTGEMGFEGLCTHKDEVEKVLDKRKKIALDRVQSAKKPQQTADAAYDLLEQNTAQVDKMEDDLDEIIEQLKEEKKAEEMGKGL